MKYLNTYQHYIVNENSRNDAIPEITQGVKLAIVLIGAPGIGKSFFSKNYILTKNNNIKIFSTDDVSFTFTKQHNVYKQNSDKINLRRLFMFIESGKSFIYDTTGVKKQNVENVSKAAQDNGYNLVYIHLMGTLDTSLKQNSERERNVPEELVKTAYSEQFKNIKFFSDLNPDAYYIVYNMNNKYKFMKYSNKKLLKRKNDRYVESIDNKDFTIRDAYLSAISLIDSNFIVNFYDQNNFYLSSNDINKETDRLNNFKLSKDFGNYKQTKFTLEVTNNKNSLSFEEFTLIINEMIVTIDDLASKGFTLKDFYASKDDDSLEEHKFYHIRFLFTKPNIKIANKSLQNTFTRLEIKDLFNNEGFDIDCITFYDEYIEIDYDDFGNYTDDIIDDKLNEITTKLGGSSYDKSVYKVKIYID